MKRTQIILLTLLLLLAAFVTYLILRNPEPPLLPHDEPHASFVSADACLSCHGPRGVDPRGPKHPVGRDCLRCHGY